MKTRHERVVLSDIMKFLGRKPHVLIVRKQVGLFYTKDGRPINVGKKGESDTLVIVGDQKCPMCEFPIHPAPIMLEVKDPLGELSEEQEDYKVNVCDRRGIPYVVAHSKEEARTLLRKYLAEDENG